MSKMANTLLKNSLDDVIRLISRSGKLDWPIRKGEFKTILSLLDTQNLDQVFDKIYPEFEYIDNQELESVDLSAIIADPVEPDVNIWVVVFMNSVVHSILTGTTIKTIQVPAQVDTAVLSVFIRCVEGANKIRNENPEEIRILPSSNRKEVKE